MISPTLSSALRIGTRGSKLARAQATEVGEKLARHGVRTGEPLVIATSGDRIRNRPLAEFGGKGLFAKELEEALLADRIDIAVHSMKDLPVDLPAGLIVAATPPRENPFDILLSGMGGGFDGLAPQARIGTSSVRRAAQIARRRSDLQIMPLRGNVDTRLARLGAHDLDAIVLAAAGLRRLGMDLQTASLLSGEDWLPALAQGALAIEMRASDARVDVVTAILNDRPTAIATACERAFQAALGGSCRTPIAGLAVLREGNLVFRGEVLAPDGRSSVATSIDTALGANPIESAACAGRDAGLSLRPAARQWLTI
ncbi:MAG: hydroxymethylbilane synthase [Rhizomicrobium sp.]